MKNYCKTTRGSKGEYERIDIDKGWNSIRQNVVSLEVSGSVVFFGKTLW